MWSEDAEYLPPTMKSFNNQNKSEQSRKRTVCERTAESKKARVTFPCNKNDCKQHLTEGFLRDCSGNQYRRVCMRGNGFCGFNSLPYSLTGYQENYEEIISDSVSYTHLTLPTILRV